MKVASVLAIILMRVICVTSVCLHTLQTNAGGVDHLVTPLLISYVYLILKCL